MMSKRGNQQTSGLYPNQHDYTDEQYRVIQTMAKYMVENTNTIKVEQYISDVLKTSNGYLYLRHAQQMLATATLPALRNGRNISFNSLIGDSADSKRIISHDTDIMLKSGHSPRSIAKHLSEFSTSDLCFHYTVLTQGVMTAEKNLAILKAKLNAHLASMQVNQTAGLFSQKPVHESASERRRTPILEM